MSKTYTISSVNDFLLIPPKRLKACLQEFRTSLELAHGISGLAGICSNEQGKVEVTMPTWIWIDDRKTRQDIQFCDVNVKVGSADEAETN